MAKRRVRLVQSIDFGASGQRRGIPPGQLFRPVQLFSINSLSPGHLGTPVNFKQIDLFISSSFLKLQCSSSNLIDSCSAGSLVSHSSRQPLTIRPGVGRISSRPHESSAMIFAAGRGEQN
jgi:hypothetical protein